MQRAIRAASRAHWRDLAATLAALATTTALGSGSPAWHRNQRRSRASARLAARHPLSVSCERERQARAVLLAHHGSMAPRASSARRPAAAWPGWWLCRSCGYHHTNGHTECHWCAQPSQTPRRNASRGRGGAPRAEQAVSHGRTRAAQAASTVTPDRTWVDVVSRKPRLPQPKPAPETWSYSAGAPKATIYRSGAWAAISPDSDDEAETEQVDDAQPVEETLRQ